MRMKPYLMLAIALIVLGGTALAQDNAPKAEVFGGYAYMRTAGNSNVSGWTIQPAFYANKWLGAVIEFSGEYQRQPESSAVYTILAGPQLADRAGRLTGFAHGLIGAAHIGDGFRLVGGGVQGSMNSFAMAFGGGIDANINERVAVRVFQVDYEYIRAKSNTSFLVGGTNNFRLAFGLVFKVK